MTLKTLLTFSISFLLTLVRLATEKEIPRVNHSPLFYLRVNYVESIYLSLVTSHEIWTFIGSMNVSRSSGPYSVPVSVLKIIRDCISEPLAFLVNDFFTSGNFPYKLKLARIISVFKKGSRFDKDNYRPISFLSNFSKIIEKLCIIASIDIWKILRYSDPLLFGFRENRQPCMLLSQSPNLLAGPLITMNLVVVYLLIWKRLLIQLIMQFY